MSRISRDIYEGNLVPDEAELKRLSLFKCSPKCNVCNRGDREKQVNSYKEFPVDTKVIDKMHKFMLSSKFSFGCYDPWGDL
jgi:hypothetical protein